MYKFILTIITSMCLSISAVAALSDADRGAINQWMTTLKTTADNAVIAELCASTKADIIEMHAPGFQRAWALLKTFSIVRGNQMSIQQIIETHNAALVEIGLSAVNNDNEFHLYRRNFNPAITDEIINQAKERFAEFTNGQKERTARSFTNMCFAAKDYNTGFNAIKDVVTNNPKCDDSIINTYFKIGTTHGGDYAIDTANTFFNMALNDTLPASSAQYVQFMIAVQLRNAIDAEQFKTQLNTIRIIYTNKLATEEGRSKWNTFVSVIDNTWRSL